MVAREIAKTEQTCEPGLHTHIHSCSRRVGYAATALFGAVWRTAHLRSLTQFSSSPRCVGSNNMSADVMALNSLVCDYLKPIREGSCGKVDLVDIRAVFGDIEVILGYAEQLLMQLQQVNRNILTIPFLEFENNFIAFMPAPAQSPYLLWCWRRWSGRGMSSLSSGQCFSRWPRS